MYGPCLIARCWNGTKKLKVKEAFVFSFGLIPETELPTCPPRPRCCAALSVILESIRIVCYTLVRE